MILNNIKTRQKDSGFTIVELLVVIVVIGILAAITIVSYTGITTRANTAANQSNASSIQSAESTYYTDNGSYVAFTTNSATTINALNANNTARVPASITVQGTVVNAAGSNIGITASAASGECISYWDYSVPATRYLGVGGAAVTSDRSGCS
jgi:prepilin-type N-terminal cleavage/methylation domain-containing protein